jgi:hypothetical protein
MTETISDDRYGDGKDKGTERLAGPVGDYLGVIHGRENTGDQGNSRRGIHEAAAHKGRHQ